jgi:hypothetical protein
MIHQSATCLSPDDFDVKTTTPECVHYAALLRLPFRLRTGKIFRFRPTDERFEVWVHNRYLIPEGATDFPQFAKQLQAAQEDGLPGPWSEAIVFLPDPYLADDTVKLIREGRGGVPMSRNAFRAHAALNQFICAYATSIDQIFGGAPLRMLADMEFFGHLRADITYLSPPSYVITDQDVEDLFDWQPSVRITTTGVQLHGQLDDLPSSLHSKIDDAFRNIRNHAFYEIAFKAKSEMVQRDPIVAIVLACAALEGVHAEFLRQATKQAIDSPSLITNLLREQGIHTLIQVTPRLLIPEDARPSNDLIKRCADAITTRNDIMHAKRSSKGKYRIREYTANELNSAYSALIEMYRFLVGRLEMDE